MDEPVKGIGGGWGAALLALLIGGAQPLAQGFRQDEVQCEEMAAHLAECCDDFDPKVVSCEYVDGCTSDSYPSVSVDESQCIREKSCEQVRAQNICERVLARQAGDETEYYAHEAVCQ
jgi:hypothetical protein